MQPSNGCQDIGSHEPLSVHQHSSYRYSIMAEDTGRAHEAQILINDRDGTEPRIEIQAEDGEVPDQRVEERMLEIARTSGALAEVRMLEIARTKYAQDLKIVNAALGSGSGATLVTQWQNTPTLVAQYQSAVADVPPTYQQGHNLQEGQVAQQAAPELQQNSLCTWKCMENTVRHHVNVFSAFAHLVDNTSEAGAHHCKIEQLRDGLVMSDDGTGFSGIRHLVDSYDVGKSYDDGNDLGFNYGQGEKGGGLMLADTILKLAALPDGSRGIVMLSRTMQKAEANSQSEHQWQLQSIWRPWAHFKRSHQHIEAWALSTQSSAADLELILKYSPFATEAALMAAFDELEEGGFRTHMILHELKSAVRIQHGCIDADVLLTDCTKGCTAKKSIYSMIAIAFPLVDDASSNTEFTLLGRKVKPLDLRPNAAIRQSETIELAQAQAKIELLERQQKVRPALRPNRCSRSNLILSCCRRQKRIKKKQPRPQTRG